MIIPSWSRTIGFLADEPAVVRAQCGRCEGYPIDLEQLIQAKGRFFSLWNRHPPCPTCKEPITFVAQRIGVCDWHTLMKTDDPAQTDRLHEIWRAEREQLRRTDAAWRFVRRFRRRRTEVGRLAQAALQGDPQEAIRLAELGLYRDGGPREEKLGEALDVLLEMRRRARRYVTENLDRPFAIPADQAMITAEVETRADSELRHRAFEERWGLK